MQQVYGKDEALLMRSQPGTKIFFRPRTIDVARSVSELAGMTTIYERKVSSSGQLVEKESGKPLIVPAEVLAMDETKMFVMTPRTPPILLPRFGWQEYLDATALSPVIKPELVIDERLVKETEQTSKPPKWQQHAEEATGKKETAPPAEVSKPDLEKKRKPPAKQKEQEKTEEPKQKKPQPQIDLEDDFGPPAE